MFGMKTLRELFKQGNRLDEQVAEDLRDPIADGNDAIRGAEAEVGKYTASVTGLVAQNKMIMGQKKMAEDDVAKYERLAQRAGEAGNETDVRTALAAKANAEQTVATLGQTITTNEAQLNKLRSDLSRARDRIATAKTDQVQLAAVITGAKIREGLANASNSMNSSDSALGGLGRLKEDAIKAQAKAEAAEEMANISAPGVELERKYADPSVTDDAVAKYLKK